MWKYFYKQMGIHETSYGRCLGKKGNFLMKLDEIPFDGDEKSKYLQMISSVMVGFLIGKPDRPPEGRILNFPLNEYP